MFWFVFSLVLAVAILGCAFLAKKKGDAALDRIIKISATAFITLSVAGLFLPDLFMCSHEAETLAAMTGTKFHAIIRWLNLVCFTVLPIAVFQQNKYFEKMASYFCLPMALVNVGFFEQYMEYFTANSNSGLQTVRLFSQEFKDFLIDPEFRSVFFGLTCLCQILTLFLLTCRNREKLAVSKSETGKLLLILAGVTYMSLPIFVPQYLFGHVDIMMIGFTLPHYIWIAITILVIHVLYRMFQYKCYESKYMLVLSMAWALMMQFSQMFTASSELNLMKLPLQLCNLGSYLALLMLVKKSDKIFHFTLIVNVVGAAIAFLVIDIGKDSSHLTRLWVVHYIVEHTKVLAIPVLCLVLRIFKPIEARSIKHFSIGFTTYYLFVFVFGTISNGFYRMFEGQHIQNFFYSNFLFMFDKEVAGRLIGFVEPLFDIWVIRMGTFEIYPVVQLLVYVVFMTVCLSLYLVVHAKTKRQRDDYANNRYLKYDQVRESESVQ